MIDDGWPLPPGDCLGVLPTRAPVEAVGPAPPYGLEFMGQDWDKLNVVADPAAVGGFQDGAGGNSYSRSRYGRSDPAQMQAWFVQHFSAIRDALKPGGHLLAFGGTRTHHRLMVGIEDAGFEIRDVIMWVYGSGFPKSHDIGKGIDKDAGATREVIGRYTSPEGTTGPHSGGHGLPLASFSADGSGRADITTPSTDAATQWDGWGTALKPAWEPIIVARNPLEGTVAQNVLAHGVGGINIDGCRIAGTKPQVVQGVNRTTRTFVHTATPQISGPPHEGRWPANLIHDGSDEVTRLMPDDAAGGAFPKAQNQHSPSSYSVTGGELSPARKMGDTGSAARFFYCAKADQADRHEGVEGRNTHPTVKPLALMRYLVRLVTPPGGTVLDPFMGSGSTGKAADLEGFRFVGIEADLDSYQIAVQRRRAQQSFRW